MFEDELSWEDLVEIFKGLPDELPKRQKVVDWEELTKTFPTEITVELRRVAPNCTQHTWDFIIDLHSMIKVLQYRLEMKVELFVERVKNSSNKLLTLTPYSSNCRQNCAVCKRVEPKHYPYWKLNGKPIDDERLRDLVLEAGVSEAEWYEYERIAKARTRLIGWYHGILIVLKHIGVIDMHIEIPPVKTTPQPTSTC
jgi:predicted deacylase